MPAEEARLYLVAAFFVPREGGFFKLLVYKVSSNAAQRAYHYSAEHVGYVVFAKINARKSD